MDIALIGVTKEMKSLAYLIRDCLRQQFDKDIIITSAFRSPDHEYYSPTSFHSFGLAIDFTLPNELIFLWCYYVAMITNNWELNGYTLAELEIVQDDENQEKYHCHVAIAQGRKPKYFTGVYKKNV